jgi:chromosome segregation ATPase
VDERLWLQQIGQLETRLGRQGRLDAITRQRIERLRGAITWKIHTEYHDRFTEATQNLRELDQHIDKLNEIYRSFVRTRQAATQSYKGYAQPIQRLRIKIGQARERIELVKARQGHMIETMAINELELRRRRLEEFQIKARFAMAESYDHATRAQQEQLKEAVEP